MNGLHECVVTLQSATEGQLIYIFIRGDHQLLVKRLNGNNPLPDSNRWMLEASLLVMQSA